ncbi:TorF family putative porin [Sphingomonas sp.]|uniref:TorF family putative porin n=1 Tax=Sphingomonas sp. TaxID=28214 RepID=UPI002ED92363
MRFTKLTLGALLLAATATPAFAQEEATEAPEPITVSGSVTLASDYRFRGVSQTDKEVALQGGVTIAHESGAYIGFWGSNLAGWGTFLGANMELDVIAGYKFPVAEGATLDVGVTYYMYPGGLDKTDFFEPYVKLSGTVGPVTLTGGVAYAPKQEALGRVYPDAAAAAAGTPSFPGDKEDNIYVSGDAVLAVPNTPLSLRAHLGYSDGNDGLGPNGTSLAPTGKYLDWALGADLTFKGLTLGVSYIDTDISAADSAYLMPNFSKTTGGDIAGSTVVVSLTAAF